MSVACVRETNIEKLQAEWQMSADVCIPQQPMKIGGLKTNLDVNSWTTL